MSMTLFMSTFFQIGALIATKVRTQAIIQHELLKMIFTADPLVYEELAKQKTGKVLTCNVGLRDTYDSLPKADTYCHVIGIRHRVTLTDCTTRSS